MDDAAAATFAAIGKFNETLIYERAVPAAVLQNELAILGEFDQEAERQSKAWGCRMSISVVVVFGCIVGTIVGFANDHVAWAAAAIVVGVVTLSSAIYCGLHYNRWSKRNIENRRYELLGELVKFLSCDMAGDAPIAVRMDGNPYHKPEYLAVREGAVISSAATSYRLPWLTMSGQLLDGHRFTITATQLVKRKEKRKRKYTKVKESLQERVDIEVRCKSQKYARWADLPVVLKSLKPAPPLEGWDLQVTGDRVSLTGLMPLAVMVTGRGSKGSTEAGLLQHGAVLGLFAHLYRGLAEVRK